MEVVRREIIQEPVTEFQKNSPSELLCTISGLIYKSRKGLSWADFEYVYTLREVRIEPGRRPSSTISFCRVSQGAWTSRA